MKNTVKTIVALAVCTATIFAASSCQLSKITKPNESDTSNSETSTGTSAQTDAVTSTPAMDLENIDLSQYLVLGKYKGFELTTVSDAISDEEYAAEVEKVLDNYSAKAEIKDRVTAEGDTLNIDFEGYMDGVQFQNGSATDQTITLSENNGYIGGFDKDLYGIMPGTVVETNVTFPENYPNDPTKAGKEATFKITVNYIIGENIDAELTDAIVSEYTSGLFNNVAEFEVDFRNRLEKQKIARINEEENEKVWQEVLNNATVIEVPQAQIDYYYEADRQYYESAASSYGMDYEEILQYIGITDAELKENARINALNDLVMYTFIKLENLKLDSAEYTERLNAYAELNNATVTEVENYYSKETLEEYFQWEKVREFLHDNSTFTIVEADSTT